jgi:hypothetical protein
MRDAVGDGEVQRRPVCAGLVTGNDFLNRA